jgi:MATE family multidrug resistance protein
MKQIERGEETPPGRLSRGLHAELRATLALAAPLAAANLAQMAMGVTNTIMVGRLGSTPLAAAGLGGAFYFTIGVILQGVLFAVAPLAAHALGAGDRAAVARTTGAGLVLSVLMSVPFVALLVSLDRVLAALGYDAALAAEIGRYLRALAWGAPAFLAFGVLRSLFSALAQARLLMAVLVVCVAGNAVLNWALIFGHLGAPALGMVGSGYASALNQWLVLAGLAAFVRHLRALSGFGLLRGVVAAGRRDILEILRLGWPIGGVRGIEVGLFLAAGILIGLFGAAALAAHQLVLNVASISFMVPLGLSQAATVRVAHQLGAARPLAARRAGFVAVVLGVAVMGAAAVILWAAPQAIIAAYVDAADPANRELVAIARRLIAIAAIFQIFDGTQTIAIGALRGYRDTMMPLALATAGFWGVGFAGGWMLAFPLGGGAVGLWWGLAVGLAVVALLLTLRLWLVGRPVGPAAAPALAV